MIFEKMWGKTLWIAERMTNFVAGKNKSIMDEKDFRQLSDSEFKAALIAMLNLKKVTKNGIVYRVSFYKDPYFLGSKAYHFFFANENDAFAPKDVDVFRAHPQLEDFGRLRTKSPLRGGESVGGILSCECEWPTNKYYMSHLQLHGNYMSKRKNGLLFAPYM